MAKGEKIIYPKKSDDSKKIIEIQIIIISNILLLIQIIAQYLKNKIIIWIL